MIQGSSEERILSFLLEINLGFNHLYFMRLALHDNSTLL